MPSLTLTTVTNKKNSERGRLLLEKESEKIEFLFPKIALIDGCESYAQYNSDILFHSYEWFDTDFILFIQFDSRIINPAAWTDEFFEYDYIGAPWIWRIMKPQYSKGVGDANRLVGNGGFSLRSRKLCELLASDYVGRLPQNESEDVFICQNVRDELESKGIKFAPYKIAEMFSMENDVYTGQFGAHCAFFFNRKLYDMKKMSDDELDKAANDVGDEFRACAGI